MEILLILYSSMDRLTEEHKTEAGIIVQNKDKQIACILCQENDPLYINNYRRY